MNDYSAVLCIGQDLLLLNLRSQVLATRFATVRMATPITLRRELDNRTFDLMVLCHTLSSRECSAAIHLFRERCPTAATLAIHTALTGCGTAEVDATTSALAGPQHLFRAIESVMRNGAPRFGLMAASTRTAPVRDPRHAQLGT